MFFNPSASPFLYVKKKIMCTEIDLISKGYFFDLYELPEKKIEILENAYSPLTC